MMHTLMIHLKSQHHPILMILLMENMRPVENIFVRKVPKLFRYYCFLFSLFCLLREEEINIYGHKCLIIGGTYYYFFRQGVFLHCNSN